MQEEEHFGLVQTMSQLKGELATNESDVLDMQTRVEKIQRANGDPDSIFDEDKTEKAKAMKELDEKLIENEAELNKIIGEIE